MFQHFWHQYDAWLALWITWVLFGTTNRGNKSEFGLDKKTSADLKLLLSNEQPKKNIDNPELKYI